MATINFTKFPTYNRKGEKDGERSLNLTGEKEFNFFDFIYKNGDRNTARKILSFEDDEDIEMTEGNIKLFLPFIKAVTPGLIGISFELFLKENELWKDEYEQLLND